MKISVAIIAAETVLLGAAAFVLYCQRKLLIKIEANAEDTFLSADYAIRTSPWSFEDKAPREISRWFGHKEMARNVLAHIWSREQIEELLRRADDNLKTRRT